MLLFSFEWNVVSKVSANICAFGCQVLSTLSANLCHCQKLSVYNMYILRKLKFLDRFLFVFLYRFSFLFFGNADVLIKMSKFNFIIFLCDMNIIFNIEEKRITFRLIIIPKLCIYCLADNSFLLFQNFQELITKAYIVTIFYLLFSKINVRKYSRSFRCR